MMKLKVNRLQELAASFAQREQLSNTALCNVKGGSCTTCQDIRIPPEYVAVFNAITTAVTTAIKTYKANN